MRILFGRTNFISKLYTVHPLDKQNTDGQVNG